MMRIYHKNIEGKKLPAQGWLIFLLYFALLLAAIAQSVEDHVPWPWIAAATVAGMLCFFPARYCAQVGAKAGYYVRNSVGSASVYVRGTAEAFKKKLWLTYGPPFVGLLIGLAIGMMPLALIFGWLPHAAQNF